MRLAVFVACAAAACTGRPSLPVATTTPSYEYTWILPHEGSWILRVDADLTYAPSEHVLPGGPVQAFRASEVGSGASRALAPDARGWTVPSCRTHCLLRYEVDLEALAAACNGMDCSRRVGGAVLGIASAFLVVPDPAGDAAIRIRVQGDPARLMTGLRRDAMGGYVLRTDELSEASYTAFGSMRRGVATPPGARLDVALLGERVRMGDAAVLDWIGNAAGRVASLFGRFPADATVFVVPVSGADDVVFGRVMSLAGASVVLLFGDETQPLQSHASWVTVHELFHLGCPSFVDEGHWLEEGLATYYEPILRERGGWSTEKELWAHFVTNMPRGLRRRDDPPSLEQRSDIDATYWGGALFALLADVGIREATGGGRSLDDAMRRVLAVFGDATHRASVADFLREGGRATSLAVLDSVYQSWAVEGKNPDLAGLWKRLGVEISGAQVELRDDAPLAGVRKAIEGRN